MVSMQNISPMIILKCMGMLLHTNMNGNLEKDVTNSFVHA